jgi:hypothetical protein
MDKNEKRLSDEINRLLKQLETLIYNSYLAALNLFQVKNSLSGNFPFWFSRNAAVDRQMNKLISDFNKKWMGWHPQCRCIQVPILVSPDDFRKMVDAEVNGEKYTPKQIKSVPSQLQKWMEKNRGRIDAANNRGTLPYRIKDNLKFTE